MDREEIMSKLESQLREGIQNLSDEALEQLKLGKMVIGLIHSFRDEAGRVTKSVTPVSSRPLQPAGMSEIRCRQPL